MQIAPTAPAAASALPAAGPAAPAAPAATPTAAASAVAAPAPPEASIGGFRGGVAEALRAVGAGFAAQGDHGAAVIDAALLHPYETVNAVGTLYKGATKDVPVLKKTGVAFTVLSYLTALQGMIATSLWRAPGDLVHNATHRAADLLDGKQTHQARGGIFSVPAPDVQPQ
jgi:hypothetical protein